VAAICLGDNARRRGRSFIVWTLLTLIPYAIFVTWPLLYLLPRLTPPRDVLNAAQNEPIVVGRERLGEIRNLRLTTDNKSFFVGVTVWIVCLLVVGIAIVLK
jgi:hypothetical protein